MPYVEPSWSDIERTTLEGNTVRLEPLKREHEEALWGIAKDSAEDIFRWISYRMRTAEDIHTFIETAMAERQRRESMVFATVERKTGRIVGSTRFMNIAFNHRRVEIGSTWITPPWQRTAVNTKAKYLMLRHAFENWGCLRVELKTDALNEKSRNAILRIGAKQEGILRKHMVTWTGRVRDDVYFSILDDEWPGVERDLEAKLGTKP